MQVQMERLVKEDGGLRRCVENNGWSRWRLTLRAAFVSGLLDIPTPKYDCS
jgi:hypothetical protein